MKKLFNLTLTIIKPDVVSNPYVLKEVQETILARKFLVVQSKTLVLTKEQAKLFYCEHEGKFFYNRLVNFITSGPLMSCILYKKDCIPEWRRLMGGTKVYKTIFEDPSSLRGAFGLTDTRNATHGSDSEESAVKEMKFFFPHFKPYEWLQSIERLKFDGNQVVFDENNFKHNIKLV